MDKFALVTFGAMGLVGYVVFHGHRLGQDCFFCNYRGIAFMASSWGLGAFLALEE